LNKVYAVTATTHTDITRAVGGDYTGVLDNKWTDAWLNGVLVLNNGVDMPQSWNPMSTSQLLVDLPNFTASGVTTLRAKVIRPFKNFLVALHITEDSAVYPTMIRWSHRADPGTVPTSWDTSDPTKAAGDVSQSNTPGFLVDCLPLRNANMVYKEDAIIRMTEVAGNKIFDFHDISNATGLLAVNCVAEFIPGQHAFLTQERDVAVHNGQEIRSIADRRVRQYLIDNIDATNFERSFVVPNYPTKELWVCYPKAGDTYCTEAAIWNWEENTWTFRELDDTVDIKSGLFSPSAVADAWSDQSENWDQMSRTWGQRLFQDGTSVLMGGFITADQLRQVDEGTKFDTTSFSSVLEHLDMALVGMNRDGSPRVDASRNKLITEVWPNIEADPGVTFNVRVGSRLSRHDAMEWQGPQVFDPNSDRVLDFMVDGPYIGIRFDSSSEGQWKMYGYSMEIHDNGRYF
jgi:hypothetical protein